MANGVVNEIRASLTDTVRVLEAIREDDSVVTMLVAAADACAKSIREGGKIIFIGNGGSAADSQHLAAEFVCRFSYDRNPLPALALTTDTSAMTAIANDFSFDHLFSRQVEALGFPGDVMICISTSGASNNILNAVTVARERGLVTVGFTGSRGLKMVDLCDLAIQIPSARTANIQESHIVMGHILCSLVERAVSPPVEEK